jgi:hypothetical protein
MNSTNVTSETGGLPALQVQQLTRAQIIERSVIDVRSMDPKSKLRSDQCSKLRAEAERLADRIGSMDQVTQLIVIGLCAQHKRIAEGAVLDGFIDEAKLVSKSLSAPIGPWRDGYGRDRGARPERMLELVQHLMVQTRCQMDPRTKLTDASCKTLRDRCHSMVESILDLEPDVQDVVIAFCVRGGIGEGSHLQTYIDQARLVIDSLKEPFPPPRPPTHT